MITTIDATHMENSDDIMQTSGAVLRELFQSLNRIEGRLIEIEQRIEASNRPWLTVLEAANLTGYSENHFREIMKREIPYFQRDRRQMISRKELEGWIERNTKEPFTDHL